MKNVIVIPTHRTGTKFLENLLASFNGYDKYPILIVVSDYRHKDKKIFENIRNKFSCLPITLEKIKINAFEMGGLYTAYIKTDYDNFFLLPHSCEILNSAIFDIVFERNENKSVALGLQVADWGYASAGQDENKKFISRHLDQSTNLKLLNLGNIKFWQGHIGKYRRVILDKLDLPAYLPTNMIEAISKSELLFTSTYHSLDESTVVLFPEWTDGNLIVEKFGKNRLKIMNEYIIKWKTHWSTEMVFHDMKSKQFIYKAKNILRAHFPGIYAKLKKLYVLLPKNG